MATGPERRVESPEPSSIYPVSIQSAKRGFDTVLGVRSNSTDIGVYNNFMNTTEKRAPGLWQGLNLLVAIHRNSGQLEGFHGDNYMAGALIFSAASKEQARITRTLPVSPRIGRAKDILLGDIVTHSADPVGLVNRVRQITGVPQLGINFNDVSISMTDKLAVFEASLDRDREAEQLVFSPDAEQNTATLAELVGTWSKGALARKADFVQTEKDFLTVWDEHWVSKLPESARRSQLHGAADAKALLMAR